MEFKKKSSDLRNELKDKFKQMRNELNVQEQTLEAVLKKNLGYMENELKGLKSIDYRMFNDADKWLKNAKKKLDNFQANNENPNYIAFDMLENAKNANDDFMDDDGDNLLLDAGGGKQGDIIANGERIAE